MSIFNLISKILLSILISFSISTSSLAIEHGGGGGVGEEVAIRAVNKAVASKSQSRFRSSSFFHPHNIKFMVSAGFILVSWFVYEIYNREEVIPDEIKDDQQEAEDILDALQEDNDPTKDGFEDPLKKDIERYDQSKMIKEGVRIFLESQGVIINEKFKEMERSSRDSEVMRDNDEMKLVVSFEDSSDDDKFIVFIYKPEFQKDVDSSQVPDGVINNLNGGDGESRNSKELGDARYKVAKGYSRLGKPSKSLMHIKKIKEKPEYKEWVDDPYNEAELLCLEGRCFYKIMRYQDAFDSIIVIHEDDGGKFEEWLKDPYNKAELLFWLGVYSLELGRPQKALDFLRVVHEDRNTYGTWCNDSVNEAQLFRILARVLFDLEGYQEARDFIKIVIDGRRTKYREVFKNSYHEANMLFWDGATLYGEGGYQEARSRFIEIRRRRGEFKLWFDVSYNEVNLDYMDAFCLHELGEYQASLALLKSILEDEARLNLWLQKPFNSIADLFYWCAMNLYKFSRHQESFDYLDKIDEETHSSWFEDSSTKAERDYWKAVNLFELRRFKKALDLFEEIKKGKRGYKKWFDAKRDDLDNFIIGCQNGLGLV